MKLSHRAIDNRVAVYLLMAIILIMGWSAYTSLPKEASPDISIPIVVVTVPYIGVSPTDIEGLVAQPLDRRRLAGRVDLAGGELAGGGDGLVAVEGHEETSTATCN